jgi:hypothetical protein
MVGRRNQKSIGNSAQGKGLKGIGLAQQQIYAMHHAI